MVIVNGKTFRNLQEQVYYLTNIIGDATDIVKNVVGAVASPSALPAHTSVNYGTTYAVGAASPYNYYVSTASGWVNLGTFPKAGPSGADGKDGNSIYLTSANLTPNTDYIYTKDIYNPSNIPYKAGDLILATNASGTYLYTVSNVRSPEVLDIVYRATLSIHGTSADVVSIDFPFGQETVGYNTTDGITLVGQTRLTDTNGETNDVATNIDIPIFPGTNVNIDAKADGTGVVISATGGDVSKEYVDKQLATKLDKITSTATASRVYAVRYDGVQTTYDISASIHPSILAFRDTDGSLKVPTPTDASQAIPKSYVDGLAETWTFTLDDGSTVVKNVLVNTATNTTQSDAPLYDVDAEV